MSAFLDRIGQGELFVADGAMGTMLFERGLKVGECPEAMNLDDLSILEEIAGLYYQAGAEIVQTNTFGGSPLKLSTYGLQDKAIEINRNAVLAVRNVIADNAFLSGSIGPCGKILKPYGDTESAQVYDSFKIQAKALLSAGVDIICVETMTDLNEALLAIKAVRDISKQIPLMATMTYDFTPVGFYTIMGVTIEQAVQGLGEAGADIIGSNCGNGIKNMIEIAGQYKKLSDLPIIIQSNAGLPEIQGTKVVYNESPQYMAEHAVILKDMGVSIIGGCCGTTPEHIRAIRKAVKA